MRLIRETALETTAPSLTCSKSLFAKALGAASTQCALRHPNWIPSPVPAFSKTTVKYIHLALGWFCVLLGMIGAVLPLLPTTVFLILAAFFFSKGSPRLRQWLITHPTFGAPIQNWEETGSIAPRIKVLALSMMALALGASLVFALPTKVIIIQALCMSAAALFIVTRPNA